MIVAAAHVRRGDVLVQMTQDGLIPPYVGMTPRPFRTDRHSGRVVSLSAPACGGAADAHVHRGRRIRRLRNEPADRPAQRRTPGGAPPVILALALMIGWTLLCIPAAINLWRRGELRAACLPPREATPTPTRVGTVWCPDRAPHVGHEYAIRAGGITYAGGWCDGSGRPLGATLDTDRRAG